jgi:cholesterol oxidase
VGQARSQSESENGGAAGDPALSQADLGASGDHNCNYDYDWVVVGSGFGGSVSALRLAEKGYRVGVLEAGQRFEDDDFPESAWRLRRFLWFPWVGQRGITRIYLFKDIAILAGCGVGGGSLVYANTLYVPSRDFFQAEEWRMMQDWEVSLAPHYEEAKRMLGATEVPFENDTDRLFRELASDMDVEYRRPTVGVYFGEPGETVSDPYFDGAGPDRAGCIRCGACMVGCRHNAKNTLRKNYLWFAEREGVEILAERHVTEIRPLGDSDDGSDGYAITARRPGAWVRKRESTLTAKGVVVAAGAVGTNWLLRSCKEFGTLPRLSDRLGEVVRTNSEALLAVTATKDRYDFHRSVAISSSIYPDGVTHIENVTYGEAGDGMGLLFTSLTAGGTRVTRPLKWAKATFAHPTRAIRLLWKRGWARRTVILLVMQTLNNSMRLKPLRVGRRKLILTTEQDPDNPNPTWIPAANEAAQRIAEKIDGVPQSNLPEALLNTPATAHILGGAVIAPDSSRGVVDLRQRVYGYENLLVCDGSVVPANPGVNPSLTITALTEHAMTFVPIAGGAGEKPEGEAEAEDGEEVVEAKDRPEGEGAQHEVGEPAEPA